MSFGAAFLSQPDLFPARRAGEPWGERAIVLDLAGGPYAVSGMSPAQAAAAEERFGAVCRPIPYGGEVAGGVASRLFRAPESDFLEIDTRGWSYSLDVDATALSVRLAGLRIMARLDWVPGLAGALWTSEEGPLFPGILENFLRVLVAYRLVEAGGALLHCAGVVDGRGRALLFLGPSGAGKTTVSRRALERGLTVLSDDLNAVLPVSARSARVEKVPFTGDIGTPGERGASGSYPLRALLRLEQGPADSLRPLGTASAVATLLACSPFVNADPHRRERLVENLAGLAACAPHPVLTCTVDGTFWSILDREIP